MTAGEGAKINADSQNGIQQSAVETIVEFAGCGVAHRLSEHAEMQGKLVPPLSNIARASHAARAQPDAIHCKHLAVAMPAGFHQRE